MGVVFVFRIPNGEASGKWYHDSNSPATTKTLLNTDSDLGTLYFMPSAIDDRDQALPWYVRRLILQEEERGVQQKDIASATGLNQGSISQMKRPQGVGLRTCVLIAAYFRRTPGELLDEALTWWERGGREEATREASGVSVARLVKGKKK